MSSELRRSERPPGVVSTVRGHWQGPALLWTTRVLLAIALLGGLVPGPVGRFLAVTAVAVVTAVPLARVLWLVVRWIQERDARFVAIGVALLATVAAGAAMAALGVGS